MIDSKSLIHESASIADNVKIGAYAVIDKNVSIGEGTIIKEHAVIRENTTINTGTVGGGNITKIGNNTLLMIGVHIAHDLSLIHI